MKMASLTPGTCSQWLWLLPSGPDQVHHPAMRGDPPGRILTQHFATQWAKAGILAIAPKTADYSAASATRRARTAAASFSMTATLSSQLMQASVMLWP